MQLASVPRKLRGHRSKFVMAAQAGPLPQALPLGVTVFAYPDNFVTKRIIQHATTSAKTRATAKLRQLAHTAERYKQAEEKRQLQNDNEIFAA